MFRDPNKRIRGSVKKPKNVVEVDLSSMSRQRISESAIKGPAPSTTPKIPRTDSFQMKKALGGLSEKKESSEGIRT